MATLSIDKIQTGVCTLPQAITAAATPVVFYINGVLAVGCGRLSLVSDVEWYFSLDGNKRFLIAANQVLLLPVHSDYILYAATVSGSGTLYAMLSDVGSLKAVNGRDNPDDPATPEYCPQAGTADFSVECTSGLLAAIAA